jgi:hypothetical protein
MLNGKADAVCTAESNIVVIEKVRRPQFPRGRRPWHAIHRYDMATRETLTVLKKEYDRQAIQSKEVKWRQGVGSPHSTEEAE